MAFAPFPPPVYLSDGARTEGEMKTAFENWLLATKQTGGHGQCRLLFISSTGLVVVPFEGRRVLVNDLAYEVPSGGVTRSNAGLIANRRYYAALVDTAGVVALDLLDADSPSIVRMVDPDSGVSMLSGDGGASISRGTTVVGMVYTNASAQFTEAGVCSLHGRRLKVHVVTLATDVVGGSATTLPVLGGFVPAFSGDSLHVYGQLMVQTQAGSQANIWTVGQENSVLWTIGANTTGTPTVSWSRLAASDTAVYVELGFSAPFGAPVTIKAGGTAMHITRLG